MSNKTILDINGRYEHKGRRTGNTTRMIDATIQLLFEGNKVIYITNIKIESENFLKRLKNRFLVEHNSDTYSIHHFDQWDNPRALKRLIIKKYSGLMVRGISYFDKDDNIHDIDGLHHSEIAVIIELQTRSEYDDLKSKLIKK